MKHRRRRRVVWGVVADATASLAARTRERVEKRDGRGINALRRAFVRSSEDDDDGYFLFLLFTPSSSSRRRRRRRSGGRARSRARTPRDAFPRALHPTLSIHRTDARVPPCTAPPMFPRRDRAHRRVTYFVIKSSRTHLVAHVVVVVVSLSLKPAPPGLTKPNQTKPARLALSLLCRRFVFRIRRSTTRRLERTGARLKWGVV